MDSRIAHLHEILKDETRRKIILQLQEKGILSYVDLMKILSISSTGKMNYHLKILGDLLSKTESGQYTLSEKGKLASQLLLEFPDNNQSANNLKGERKIWVLGSLFSIIYLILALVLYLIESIDFEGVVLNVLTALSAIFVLHLALKLRLMRRSWSIANQMIGVKISYVIVGGLIGAVGVCFGGGFLLVGFIGLLRLAGIMFRGSFRFEVWIVFSLIFGAVIGGLVGYLFYKRRKCSKSVH